MPSPPTWTLKRQQRPDYSVNCGDRSMKSWRRRCDHLCRPTKLCAKEPRAKLRDLLPNHDKINTRNRDSDNRPAISRKMMRNAQQSTHPQTTACPTSHHFGTALMTHCARTMLNCWKNMRLISREVQSSRMNLLPFASFSVFLWL